MTDERQGTMTHSRLRLSLVAAVAVTMAQIAAIVVPQPAPARAEEGAPVLSGPARRYAPSIDAFGRGGGAYTKQADAGYWLGRGFLFGFDRDEWEAYESNPWGGYLVGGIVLAADQGAAASELPDIVRGWTADGGFEPVAVRTIGDEAVAYRRLSRWEINKQQPMEEVFVAFRYRNANAHFIVATMPEFDATTQALRYAQIILDAMHDEARPG